MKKLDTGYVTTVMAGAIRQAHLFAIQHHGHLAKPHDVAIRIKCVLESEGLRIQRTANRWHPCKSPDCGRQTSHTNRICDHCR